MKTFDFYKDYYYYIEKDQVVLIDQSIYILQNHSSWYFMNYLDF